MINNAVKYVVLFVIISPFFLRYIGPKLPEPAQDFLVSLGIVRPFSSYVDDEFEGYDDDRYDDRDNNYAYDDYDTESDW